MNGAYTARSAAIAPLVIGADDDAVGLHEVLDRGAFFQELRVGRHGKGNFRAAPFQLLSDRRTDAIGGAHRHGRLVDDDLGLRHAPADIARGLDHVLHVGAAILVRRRADGDELQRAVRDGAVDIGGELQPAGRHVAANHGFQSGLVDRHATLLQHVDLGSVDVEAQHVIADFGQARAGDQPDIAGTDHRDFHAAIPMDALMDASAATGSPACVIGRPTTR